METAKTELSPLHVATSPAATYQGSPHRGHGHMRSVFEGRGQGNGRRGEGRKGAGWEGQEGVWTSRGCGGGARVRMERGQMTGKVTRPW